MKRFQILFSALLIGSFSGLVQAGTATSSFQVSASVPLTCTISSVPALSFGSYNSTNGNDAQIQFSVSCSSVYNGMTVALSNGANATSTSPRYLKSASKGSKLAYNLYQDSAHKYIWGSDENALTMVSDASTGETFTVYANAVKGQTSGLSAVSDYSDTIAVTVTYN